MKVSPYVFFGGDARAALNFYAEVFETKPVIMDASGMPDEYGLPDEKKSWVMHGHIDIGNDQLLVSDNLFNEAEPMAGCSVQVNYATAAEAKIVFDKLADGGKITMAWNPTFWSAGFGAVHDKFGVRWMLGCDEAPKS